ncbi:NAD(P)-dependent oxidoreductase [Methylobacterium sp. Leaf88]|uniref:NAD-dependent epimerase/dehydratase family protein n=1 Tax=Methylobacterium sp. Leaf88 TaxID=1736244 RepID=UPI0006FA8B9B|nr:NAD(P)-dependent oxidoreductase [Methylobacterium sp. Leaf88]KQO65635.1 NAD-dependent dehydratase [Methylobacterium sp. Leaf88]
MRERVLVTGAAGFVGRHAVPALRARGFEVHGVGRAVSAEAAWHAADLLVPAERQALIAKIRPSHLLHLAWDAEPGRYWTSARNLDWVAATLDLAQAFAAAGGRRFVGAGTCAEYEWGAARFEEATTPCRPATLYGAAKDGTRRILEAYAATQTLSVAWGRLFYLYGPGERRGRLVSDAIRALTAGTAFPTSHGHQRRDFLHVADAAAALAALVAGDVPGPVNIGSGAAIPVRALLKGLAARIGGAEHLDFGARPLSPTEPPVIEAGTRILTETVGFRPRFDVARGLDDTVAWWRARGKAPG